MEERLQYAQGERGSERKRALRSFCRGRARVCAGGASQEKIPWNVWESGKKRKTGAKCAAQRTGILCSTDRFILSKLSEREGRVEGEGRRNHDDL